MMDNERATNHRNKDDDEIEISLTDLLLSIWDLRWVILLLILLGGVVGMLFSSRGASDYRTKASMIVTSRTSEGTYQNGSAFPKPEDIYLSQKLTKTVRLLATSDRVLKEVLSEDAYSHIAPEELRERIDVTAEDDTSFLWLTLSWNNEEEAVGILNRLMEILPGIMTDVMDVGDISIIDLAEHAAADQSRMPKGVLLGALLGLVLGCFLGILYYLFVPKVRGISSLDALGLDFIGEIPTETDGKETKSCYLDEDGHSRTYLEAYGRLAVVFRYLTEQKQKKIIAVTSSISGEGKSTLAYNLAFQLTATGNKVLLLDFDFKKGVLYQLAKARKPRDGEVRTESRNVDDLEKHLEQMFNGIYTIQGFSEKDLFQVDNKIFPGIRKLKDEFDYILIDAPSVGILSDVQQMRDLLGGVLFVVRENIATVGHVTKSMEFLEQAGIEVIGCVMNGEKNHFQIGRNI